MLLFQQERRQETNDRVLRAVEQHSLCQGSIDNRARRNLQLNSLNESSAANSDGSGLLLDDFLQLLLQVSANFVHILQQLLIFDDRQVFQRHAASQGAA